MCESLETLKLDVNLDLHHVYTMSSFRLLNLKQLHLRASFIFEDGFVSRLVSSCPVLEDSIFSSSLRKLTSTVLSGLVEAWNIGSVVIHTPNLEDLRYFDETGPYQYSINNLDRFGKVSIRIDDALNVLSFIRPLSNVKHLCLKGCLNEIHKLMKFLFIFCSNLSGEESTKNDEHKINEKSVRRMIYSVMLEGAKRSAFATEKANGCRILTVSRDSLITMNVTTLECCKSHLKRIEIHNYFGDKREIDLIRFLLRNALILEELVVLPCRGPSYESPDQKSMESTLKS
ncbi:hypothetical protein RDABS01_039420 [Bienertia sinuspersici]